MLLLLEAEGQQARRFPGRRFAAQADLERRRDARYRRAVRLAQQTVGEAVRVLGEARVVQQREGLQRGRRAVAAGAGRRRVRGVERGQRRVRGRPLEVRVHAAAVAVPAGADRPGAVDLGDLARPGRLRRVDARPADLGVEQPARGEGHVADQFGVQAEPGLPGEQEVARVAVRQVRPDLRRLPVGRGRDHEPVKRLLRPVQADELGGQPVEQFGVRRQRPLGAEVVLGGDQPGAEVDAPDAVDEDPRGQRILRGDEPAGQVEAGRPVVEFGQRRQDGRRPLGDFDALAGEVAAEHDVRLAGHGPLRQDQRLRPRRLLPRRLRCGYGVGRVEEEVGVVLVVEEGQQPVVVALRDRVELVVVALAAADGQAEPDAAGGVDAIDDGLDAELFHIDAAFFVNEGVAVEAGGDALAPGGVRQQVAGQLLDRELVERQVGVQGGEYPVAVRPDRPRRIDAEAVAVGVPGQVQPDAAPPLAVVRGRQ